MKKWFHPLSFKASLLVLVAASSSIPAIMIGLPLFNQLMDISEESATGELTVRTESAAKVMNNELDLIIAKIKTL